MLFHQSLAQSATFSFEGLSDSTPVTSQISGVSFQNTIALVSGIGLNELEHPPRSGTTVVSDDGRAMTISFTSAQASVSGFFTYLKPITMRTFNASNAQIGTVSSKAGCASNQTLSGTAGCPSNEKLSITATGITMVTITGDAAGTSFTLDDLETTSSTGTGDISILTPAEGSILTSSAVTFSWSPAPGSGKSYEFKVFNTQANVLELSLSILGTLTTQVYTFKSGQYRLEMRSCSPTCGAAVTSSFRVQLPAFPTTAPSGISCQMVNDTSQNRLNCAWSQQTGADFYFVNVVQPGAGPGGGALTVAGTQSGPNSVSLLIPNGNASFLVRGCTGDGCGPLSNPIAVNPTVGSPTVPIIAEPFNGSVIDAGTQTPSAVFTWNRVAGDNGTNYKYRLYVQDFSRNAAAVDVLTTSNFHGVYLTPFTRYDALVIAVPNTGPIVQGPASGFVVKGRVPNAPSLVSPTVFSTVPAGTVRLGWTPLPDATGTVIIRNYQFYLAGPVSQSRSAITQNISVELSLASGSYNGIVRACTTGTTCTATSETGWGPWTGSSTGEGGPISFTVQ